MSQDFGNGYNSGNSIAIIWCIDDVLTELDGINQHHGINLELSDEDCMQVLDCVERYHDCNLGISWENIYQAIDDCFRDEIEEAKAKNNLKEEE